MDGATALGYVRSRHADDDGDFGRIRRQQRFLRAVLDETVSMGTLVNVPRLVSLIRSGARAVTTDEDLGLWFTEQAKVWNADTETHEWQSVRGGSAGYQTAFDPDGRATIAPAWMSTANSDDRVVAHGASMEMMHAMVDGGLGPVQQCHGGHGEHSLGNAVYEYNGDYGQWGHFGSPIAAGPHTWERGACASGVDEKDGITFTLTPCTKLAVRQTKRDRVADLSMCAANCSGPEVPPMDGGCPPVDHDGDGLCEDVRGTGDVSMLDVQMLFENLQSEELQEHSEAFNFSGLDPGEVTILDVQSLFNEMNE
jgi:hypothetical protein